MVAGLGDARAQHEHTPPPPAPGPSATGNEDRKLFQSDMSLMAGMTPDDPDERHAPPGWSRHVLGVARLSYNDQGGPSGRSVLESSNWNMVMAQRAVGRGRLTLM
ncbi:MAG: hypothetical protein H7X85_10390, partial [Thermoanaerobaculia bacterium]|nr:hypothetical protein [Thermoanaerobaculia bacterium]